MMEILNSVDAREVPEGQKRITHPGVWSGLVKRAIADFESGKVTVIVMKDETEYKKMRNGIAQAIRDAGYRTVPTVVPNPDGSLKVFLEVERLKGIERNNNHPRRPAASGVHPVRH